jgi:hypothetical protein
MVDTYIPYANYGQALSESQSFGINTLFLDGPDVVTESEPLCNTFANSVIPALTVVEWIPASSGVTAGIGPAVVGSGNALKGILTADYDGTVSTLKKTPIFRTGKFNVAALRFDASFTTSALKYALFEPSSALFLGEITQPSV